MPARKRPAPPQNVGFYFSMSDYQLNAYRATEKVTVYIRTHIGQWYANGELVKEAALPDDLWQLRPVQK